MKKTILTFVAAAAITGTAGANAQAEEVTVKKAILYGIFPSHIIHQLT